MNAEERLDCLEKNRLFRIARVMVVLNYWVALPVVVLSMCSMAFVCVWLAGYGHAYDVLHGCRSSIFDPFSSLGLAIMGPLALAAAWYVWRARARMQHPRSLYPRR